jgi:hypothetical protein
MDPAALTPTEPREVDIYTRHKLSRTITGEMGYRIYDRAYHLLFGKQITPTMMANISQNVKLTQGQSFIDQNRDSLTLLGWTVIF